MEQGMLQILLSVMCLLQVCMSMSMFQAPCCAIINGSSAMSGAIDGRGHGVQHHLEGICFASKSNQCSLLMQPLSSSPACTRLNLC